MPKSVSVRNAGMGFARSRSLNMKCRYRTEGKSRLYTQFNRPHHVANWWKEKESLPARLLAQQHNHRIIRNAMRPWDPHASRAARGCNRLEPRRRRTRWTRRQTSEDRWHDLRREIRRSWKPAGKKQPRPLPRLRFRQAQAEALAQSRAEKCSVSPLRVPFECRFREHPA